MKRLQLSFFKRQISVVVCVICSAFCAQIAAQSLLTAADLAKREKRKNLTVKEWSAEDPVLYKIIF